jgi:hypothetical protein
VPQISGIHIVGLPTFGISTKDVSLTFEIHNKQPINDRRVAIKDIIHINGATIVLRLK